MLRVGPPCGLHCLLAAGKEKRKRADRDHVKPTLLKTDAERALIKFGTRGGDDLMRRRSSRPRLYHALLPY